MIPREKAFVVMWAVVVTCLLLLSFFSYYFVHHRPDSPEAELGRLYPLNVHGWVVFLTWIEKWLMNVLCGLLFGGCVSAVVSWFVPFRWLTSHRFRSRGSDQRK